MVMACDGQFLSTTISDFRIAERGGQGCGRRVTGQDKNSNESAVVNSNEFG